MKAYRKIFTGLFVSALAGTMICTAAFAEEAQNAPQNAAAEIITQTDRTFVTPDGVLSIQFPQDDDNWSVIDDPNSWFAISDGKDLIAIDHLAAGEPLPATETANEHYEEVFQVFYSTQNEVFVITGSVADKQEAQTVRDAVCSFQVLKYDTVKKQEEVPQPVYAVRETNQILYCTEIDGVNVRRGYTTDDPVIGGLHRGDQVNVTGVVTKDGADIGWLQINYNGQTAYCAAQFFSTTNPVQPAPAPQPTTPAEEETPINGGQIFTGNQEDVYDANGNMITLKELSQGGWADEATGEIFFPAPGTDQWFGDRGTTLTGSAPEEELINDGQIFTGHQMTLYNEETLEPVVVSELSQGDWADEATGEVFEQEGGGGDHYYGDRGTTLVSEWYYNEYLQ